MALVLQDRVREQSTTTGTGTFSLGGSFDGFRTFVSCIPSGSTTYYCIVNTSPGVTEWEVGVGTFTGPDQLARTTVLSSSNAGALVPFTAGDKDVFVTYPAEKAVFVDGAGVVHMISATVSSNPIDGQDVANKAYVDLQVTAGLDVHEPVKADSDANIAGTYTNGGTTPTWTTISSNSILTTGSAHGLVINDVIVFGSTTNGLTAGTPYFVEAIPSPTQIALSLSLNGPVISSLTNGTGLSITSLANSGVGATLESTTNTVFPTLEGYAIQTGERVILLGQTNAYENGVYTLTQQGSGSQHWILTRSSTENKYGPGSSYLDAGSYFLVTNGIDAGEAYVLGTEETIVFGTTALDFNEFSIPVVYTAGTGLTKTGLEFSIANTAVTAGVYGTDARSMTLTVNAQGQITNLYDQPIAITSSQVSGLAPSATTDTTNADNITSGTLPTGRISGSYTGLTGVGALSDGTWQANTIAATYGGTGLSSYTGGDIIYATSGTTLGKLNLGTSGYILAADGTGPFYKDPATITVGIATNLYDGLAGAVPYQSASSTTAFSAAGTSGQLFTSNGASAPSWTSQSDIVAGKATNIVGGTNGALPYQSGVDTTSMLAAGTSGYVLQSGGAGAPSWLAQSSIAAGSATTATKSTNIAGGGAGQVPYNSGADTTAFVPIGTTGQVFTSNGTSAPSWTTLTSANDGTLTMNVSGTGLSGSATFTANQAGASTFTVTSNATNANTASTIVARDASGNFSAGTITATLSGTATTASTANALNTGNSYTGVNFTASTSVYASGAGGFYSSTYVAGARNPIWRFANADGYGLSFFQGAAGSGGADTIGFHFGTATAAGSQFIMTSGGNFTATGNITAYSDERIKKDWSSVSDNFVEKLAQVKSGTYTRIDTGARQAGSSAQDWQKLLPEVVIDSEDTLSLAYGNAALVSSIELAKEFVNLKAELQLLKDELAKLKG